MPGELRQAGAIRGYDDPVDLLVHLDEIGGGSDPSLGYICNAAAQVCNGPAMRSRWNASHTTTVTRIAFSES